MVMIASDILWVLPLHSTLSPADQAKVFQRPAPGRVKVVLSTNICETSINICLGRNFSGSAMQFQNVNGRQGEGTSPPHQQHLEHVPGRAFLNLCQHYHGTNALVSGERHAVVIRGLSSRFRRSPGEEWSAHCPRRGVEPPVFGGDL